MRKIAEIAGTVGECVLSSLRKLRSQVIINRKKTAAFAAGHGFIGISVTRLGVASVWPLPGYELVVPLRLFRLQKTLSQPPFWGQNPI